MGNSERMSINQMYVQHHSALWVKREQLKLCKFVHSGFGRHNIMLATQYSALKKMGKLYSQTASLDCVVTLLTGVSQSIRLIVATIPQVIVFLPTINYMTQAIDNKMDNTINDNVM